MNENCLKGIACPRCGSFEPFRIAANVTCTVSDDGVDDSDSYYWEPESWMMCLECGYDATVKQFTVKEEPTPCAT